MFEQIFKNIDDLLYKDAGADSELDYIGQTSWVLFLRYLDDKRGNCSPSLIFLIKILRSLGDKSLYFQ